MSTRKYRTVYLNLRTKSILLSHMEWVQSESIVPDNAITVESKKTIFLPTINMPIEPEINAQIKNK